MNLFEASCEAFALFFTQLLCECGSSALRASRLVRYVPSNAEALQKTARHGDVAWLIFPIFYFIGVAIMFEILLAFTVEAYIELREENEKEEEEEMEREESEQAEQASYEEHGGHGEHEKKEKEQLDIVPRRELSEQTCSLSSKDTFFEEALVESLDGYSKAFEVLVSRRCRRSSRREVRWCTTSLRSCL